MKARENVDRTMQHHDEAHNQWWRTSSAGEARVSRWLEVVKRPTAKAGLTASLAPTQTALLLPDHSDGPLFTWSFVALEVRFLEAHSLLALNGTKRDVLGGRTSTNRASASNRTIKISASIATTLG